MRTIILTNHIALFEPLMPANTGNIARTCAGTDTALHLIEPLGFKIDDKHLKRAGLDYWDSVDITYHADLQDFLASIPDLNQLYLVSKFAEHDYTDVDYSDTGKITISYLVRKRQGYQNHLCANIPKRPFGFLKMIHIFEP